MTAGLLPILVPGLYRSFSTDLRLLLGSGVTLTSVVGVVVHLVFVGVPHRTAKSMVAERVRHRGQKSNTETVVARSTHTLEKKP
ncbi:hypothetical protein DFR70_102759 [Nocardia tenerifensis]|uniref:Uncharacterized protein n=1 Tax=Nocardia tenerifensis TaxID=228006 RepID=A0A318K7Z8_9NOCA|nr:hypothetical protein DFR70_102759 [Nocardia tenerifensis]